MLSAVTKFLTPGVATVILLVIANMFMYIAWYGHLKLQTAGVTSNWPLYLVVVMSWGVALLEYSCQVPANRIGFEGNGGPYSLMQLKVMQEVITLVIFMIFSLFVFEGFAIRWNHILAMILLVAAVWLVFMK